jgi:hypothetical protein
LWKVSEDGWRSLADESRPTRVGRSTPTGGARPPSIISSAPPPVQLEVLRARTRVATPAPSRSTPPPAPSDELAVSVAADRGWRLQTPPQPIPIVAAPRPSPIPSWNDSERRLWRIAGSLMVLAIFVVGVLGVITFWPSLVQPPLHADSAPAPAPAPAAAPLAAAKAEPPRAVAKSAAKPVPARRHLKAKRTQSRRKH